MMIHTKVVKETEKVHMGKIGESESWMELRGKKCETEVRIDGET